MKHVKYFCTNIRFFTLSFFAVLFIGGTFVSHAFGFVPGQRWTTTASGGTGQSGSSITLTWGFVADGTNIPNNSASDLIASLDGRFGAGPGGSDYTQRPWFARFEQSFNRWGELGGIDYIYEPNDDGGSTSGSRGVLGVRADVRIAGTSIDGASGTLAFNSFPNNGDMVLDTDDVGLFANAAGNYRFFRNVIMHEHGHGFGMNHVESNTSRFLLEPFISTQFDGPQFDDIRAIQWFYGDVYEKGQGNDTAANATPLGFVDGGSSVAIGTDAGFNTTISSNETDFVSIDRDSDFDYFSFSIDNPSLVDITLAPRGATYNQGVQGGNQSQVNTLETGDLSLSLYDSNGTTLLISANNTSAGLSEVLQDYSLEEPGEYFVRVHATADDNIQFYQLDIAVEDNIIVIPDSADFDGDGDVDGADFLAFQIGFGITQGQTQADGDANHDGGVNAFDFGIWQQQYGTENIGDLGVSTAVPEPGTASLLLLVGCAMITMYRRS